MSPDAADTAPPVRRDQTVNQTGAGGMSWELDEAGFRRAASAYLREGRRSWAAPALIMAGYPLDRNLLLHHLEHLPGEHDSNPATAAPEPPTGAGTRTAPTNAAGGPS